MNSKIKQRGGIIGCLILTVLMVCSVPCNGGQGKTPNAARETDFHAATQGNNGDQRLNLTAAEKAWLKTHPDIELGYTDAVEPEIIANPDGSYSGMIVDFLDALNKKLDTDMRLRIDPIPKLLEKAKTGGIDGILNIHPEYADHLDLLKTRAFWPGYPTVFARRDAFFEGPDDFRGKRIAIIDGVYFSEKMMGQYGKQATVLKVNNALEGLRSVDKGDSDLFLSLSFSSYFIAKYQLMGVIPAYIFLNSPEKFGIAIRSDWPELVSILNKGISSFSKEDIHAIIATWSYFPKKQDTIELTPEERAWLKQDHTVRVRVTDHLPYLYAKDGKVFGIAVDLINAVSECTGIKFHFVMPSPSFADDLKGLIQHSGPDLIATLMPTPEREKKILFTKSYISSPRFIFIRDDAIFVASMKNLSSKTVAVIKGYVVHTDLAKNYPHINLLTCRNNKEALKAVSTGKAFAFIGDLISTPAMINEFGLKNLKAAAPSSLQDHSIAMGIRNDWPELRDIINKALDVVPHEQKAAIINKWSSVQFDYGIKPSDIIKWILVVGGSASGIVLLFLFWNRALAKRVKERTSELLCSHKLLEVEIIERKQAEHTLQKYQHRLKSLASQLTVTEEKERRRIADDLHDQIGQSLALARMQIASAKKSATDAGLTAKLDDISEILREAVHDTRHLMFDLSPPAMHQLGLGAAISEWLHDQIENRYGIKTEFFDNIDKAHRKVLDEDVRAILFRNVRELLINVVKHAQAKQVSVSMEVVNDVLKIVVQDDGIGFDYLSVSQPGGTGGGFGLFSIEERMTDLGGALKIESKPGKGCEAIISVPLRSDDDGVQRK